MNTDRVNQFFSLARERYRIKLNRDAGCKPPWTLDTTFQQYRFTNVFREDDKTTTWFRKEIREPLIQQIKGVGWDILARAIACERLVEATVAFRWFNKIETGEIIKDLLLNEWFGEEAYNRLKDVHPVVTGAYMIKTVTGMKKAEGIIYSIETARKMLPQMIPSWGTSLERAWTNLKTIPYLGPFMAHEVIQDLRWTPILQDATDINTWTNCGPGATRGMSYILLHPLERFNRTSSEHQEIMRQTMLKLLDMSKIEEYWPQNWPAWELHEVEMWLCEAAKYWKIKDGMQAKRRYP